MWGMPVAAAQEETGSAARKQQRGNGGFFGFGAKTDGIERYEMLSLRNFMRRVTVAVPVSESRELDNIMHGTHDGNFRALLSTLADSRTDADFFREAAMWLQLGISLHFSRARKLFYISKKANVPSGLENVERLFMDPLPRWGNFLKFMRKCADIFQTEVSFWADGKKAPKGMAFGGICEYHLPNYEKAAGGNVSMNPCSLGDHESMLWRFISTVNEFNRHNIPPTAIVITEHVGYTMRDGMLVEGLEREDVAERDGLLNQLIYNMYLGKIDEKIRKTRGKHEYRHAFEVMPEDNVASHNLSKPHHLIVTGSAYGGIVPDVAHIMQNRHLREFAGLEHGEFRAYVNALLDRLDIRHMALTSHLDRINKVMEEFHFSDVRLEVKEIKAHLERLRDMAKDKANHPKRALEPGLDTLFHWVRMAKEWRDKQKRARDRLSRPLMPVVHVVSAAVGMDSSTGASKEITDIASMEDPAEVMHVFRSDRRYQLGESEKADAIMRAIMREAVRTLGKFDYARLCFVCEAKPQGENSVENRAKESMELNADLWKIYQETVQ
jgi:hypothetical protein